MYLCSKMKSECNNIILVAAIYFAAGLLKGRDISEHLYSHTYFANILILNLRMVEEEVGDIEGCMTADWLGFSGTLYKK